MQLTIGSTATLNNGVEIPRLGLGVYQSRPGRETQNAVRWALECGYRHFDTARIYRNEVDVGLALRASGIPRQQLFVTTKLWNDDHGYESALRACEASLQRLGFDYVDLYLIHWPEAGRRTESWRAMIQLQAEGKCRAIGVSNYMIRHLEELLSESPVVPAVNQIEFNPFLYQKELKDYCEGHGIVVEAYSPLSKGRRLRHATLVAIAERRGRTPVQILIRWALQHDLIVIPKSVRHERICDNAKVFDFELGPGEMQILDSLHENLHTGWDPTHAP